MEDNIFQGKLCRVHEFSLGLKNKKIRILKKKTRRLGFKKKQERDIDIKIKVAVNRANN